MPKINQEEYEVLKELDDKRKWIARDGSGELYAYEEKPKKFAVEWVGERDYYLYRDETFQFIQWEDENPYNIAELIEEYEDYQYTADWHAEQFDKLSEAIRNTESEEIEVKKDLDWLKNELREIREKNDKGNNFEGAASMNLALRLVDQLDEPDTLSQNWIDEHKVARINNLRKMTTNDVVPVKDLQNLLVPKQEETNDDLYILKVGGGYVTDFELTGGRVSAFSRGSEYGADVVMASKPFMEFVQKQVGGELYNITNPEEQKYRVLDGNTTLLGRINGSMLTTVEILEYYPEFNPTFEFTEQEIKDYDERYIPFMVPVDEVNGE